MEQTKKKIQKYGHIHPIQLCRLTTTHVNPFSTTGLLLFSCLDKKHKHLVCKKDITSTRPEQIAFSKKHQLVLYSRVRKDQENGNQNKKCNTVRGTHTGSLPAGWRLWHFSSQRRSQGLEAMEGRSGRSNRSCV